MQREHRVSGDSDVRIAPLGAAQRSRTGSTWPFVGRDDERRRAIRHLVSPSGGCVLVSGPPGSGKTRLLREVQDGLRGEGRRSDWLQATPGTATLPLGIFIERISRHASPLSDLTGTAAAVLRSMLDGVDRTDVILLDDAEHLDPVSEGLLERLAATSACRVAAVVGHPQSARLHELTSAVPSLRLAVDIADVAAVTELLSGALGGHVDAETAFRLQHFSSGNLDVLVQLVESARAAGSLRTSSGRWRLTGPLMVPEPLEAVVMARLGRLPPDALTVAEALALTGPIALEVLTRTGIGIESVARAERSGVVAADVDGDRTLLRIREPIVSAVLREHTPHSARTHYRISIATSLRDLGEQRWGDTLLSATLLLDAGETPTRDVLRVAVRQAWDAADVRAVERLTRAVARLERRFGAYLAVVDARAASRADDVSDEYLALAEGATSSRERTRAAAKLALYRGFTLDDGDAAETIERLAAPTPGTAGRRSLTLAALLLAKGQVALALDALAGAPSRISDRWSPQVVIAKAWSGQVEVSAALADRIRRSGSNDASSESGSWGTVARWVVCCRAGNVRAAHGLASHSAREALAWRSARTRPVWTYALGHSALLQGDLAAARTALEEAQYLLETSRVELGRLLLARTLGDLARVEAAASNADLAQRRARAAAVLVRPDEIVPEAELGRAWAMAAAGDLDEAHAIAVRLADACSQAGGRGLALDALHEAARFARPGSSVEVPRELDDVDGALASAQRCHVRAVHADDGTALEVAAAAFADLGMAGVAGSISRQAASAHARAGNRGAAARSRARADALDPCVTAVTSAMPASLTKREQTIAQFASDGRSNREIAIELCISVRTVENHLQHIYEKLFVTSRDQLRTVFGSDL